MNPEKLRASFNQFLRLVQLGFALLFLCMGGMLLFGNPPIFNGAQK